MDSGAHHIYLCIATTCVHSTVQIVRHRTGPRSNKLQSEKQHRETIGANGTKGKSTRELMEEMHFEVRFETGKRVGIANIRGKDVLAPPTIT